MRELPGFVLVSESGAETKVVIRGAAHAEFTTDDGTVTVEGSSATTWAERSLTGVRTMRVDVADAAGDDLLIRDGLVRIARTDRPAYDGEAAAAPDLEVVAADDVAPDVNVMDETALVPGPPRRRRRPNPSQHHEPAPPPRRALVETPVDTERHRRGHRRPPPAAAVGQPPAPRRPSTTA